VSNIFVGVLPLLMLSSNNVNDELASESLIKIFNLLAALLLHNFLHIKIRADTAVIIYFK
jgi:hypothetical protein